MDSEPTEAKVIWDKPYPGPHTHKPIERTRARTVNIWIAKYGHHSMWRLAWSIWWRILLMASVVGFIGGFIKEISR